MIPGKRIDRDSLRQFLPEKLDSISACARPHRIAFFQKCAVILRGSRRCCGSFHSIAWRAPDRDRGAPWQTSQQFFDRAHRFRTVPEQQCCQGTHARHQLALGHYLGHQALRQGFFGVQDPAREKQALGLLFPNHLQQKYGDDGGDETDSYLRVAEPGLWRGEGKVT